MPTELFSFQRRRCTTRPAKGVQLRRYIHIRPFCVGRANWHLIDSIKGAQASAAVYSIVETAKANQLKPYEYLKYILTEMPKHMDDTDFSFLDDLLPWAEAIPTICKK